MNKTPELNAELKKLLDDAVNAIIRPALEGGKVGAPVTIMDLIWKGAYLVKTALMFELDPNDTELLETVRSRDPERVKSLIWTRHFEKIESIEDISNEVELIKQFVETPRGYRPLFKALVDEHIPASKAGRYSKIQQKELPELAKLSEQLLPPVEKLLLLREIKSQHSIEEMLDFLSKDSPGQIEYIKARVSLLNKLLSDDRLFVNAKSTKAQARLLSDALAGDKWRIKPSYSIKMAKTARQLTKRSQKK
jgi:hypothetical protein